MILNERVYKKYSDIYYHGSPYSDIDKARAKFPCFYLTTNVKYAASYAYLGDGCFGTIFECYLKKDINLFNAEDEKDYEMVRTYLLDIIEKDSSTDKYSYYLSKLPDLRNKDYIDVLMGESLRDEFLKILKGIGYDGFFNYEITGNVLVTLSQRDMPAIGVFDIDSVDIVKATTGMDLLKMDWYEGLKKDELKYLKEFIYRLIKNGKSKEQIKEIIVDKSIIDPKTNNNYFIIKDSFLVLSRSTVNDIVDNFDENRYILNECENIYLKEANINKGTSISLYHGYKLTFWEEKD